MIVYGITWIHDCDLQYILLQFKRAFVCNVFVISNASDQKVLLDFGSREDLSHRKSQFYLESP